MANKTNYLYKLVLKMADALVESFCLDPKQKWGAIKLNRDK